ncbi:hypothetical protein QR680_008189 [Steinernema hermaphroditum]|uniref:Uncharacterized protein n=1 Tax=Steinernema hermaphroditum TaxID=289476 RepID=A0AA39M7F6_9BILA|nr:hypothetical protein QR680_008189 [Steinernema hermaphroditum]
MAKKKPAASAATPTTNTVAKTDGPIFLDPKSGEITLKIHAKPGAKISAITDVGEQEIGVAIAAPPRDGQANEELIDSMSKFLGLRKSELAFDKGATSRSKILKINTQRYTLEEIRQKLIECASQP